MCHRVRNPEDVITHDVEEGYGVHFTVSPSTKEPANVFVVVFSFPTDVLSDVIGDSLITAHLPLPPHCHWHREAHCVRSTKNEREMPLWQLANKKGVLLAIFYLAHIIIKLSFWLIERNVCFIILSSSMKCSHDLPGVFRVMKFGSRHLTVRQLHVVVEGGIETEFFLYSLYYCSSLLI